MKGLLLAPILPGLASAISLRATSHDGVSFGYDGPDGPFNWHALSEDNIECGTGRNQSPIALSTEVNGVVVVKGDNFEIKIEDDADGAEVVNRGTTLEVSAKGTLKLEREEYALQRFHFHTPSEHHINGEVFALEAHFVFEAQDESTAVVGIMIEVARDEPESDFFFNVLSYAEDVANADDSTTTGPFQGKDVESLIHSSNIFQYSGSLTTPPCTEGVKWSVVEKPAFVSAATFACAKSVLGFNARFTQGVPGERNLLDTREYK